MADSPADSWAARYPVLADHVRLQPLTDFVKVVQVRSGEILHLDRREALCLELARGSHSLGEIAQTIAGVYELDIRTAAELAVVVLGQFGADVDWRDLPGTPHIVSDPLRLFRLDPGLRPPSRYRQERPTRLTLSVTTACNYRCHHCCNRSGLPLPGELGDDEWRGVIRSAGEIGMVSITFSGGEPLMRPGLPTLIGEASAAGIYSILSTNASLIDGRAARRLAASGLRFAHVSLPAATAPLYDRLSGRHGWYEKAVAGIRHLTSEGIYVRVKTVLLPANVTEVPAALRLVSDLGVDEIHLAPYRMTHLAPAGSSLLLDTEDFVAVADAVQQWRAETGSSLQVRSPVPQQERLEWSGSGDIVRCGGVKQELTVLPDGRITVCEVLRDCPEFVLGHVLRDGLLAVWQSDRPERAMTEAAERATGPCRSCEYLPNCRTGCFSLSIACGGTATSPDPRCWKAEYPDNPFRPARADGATGALECSGNAEAAGTARVMSDG